MIMTHPPTFNPGNFLMMNINLINNGLSLHAKSPLYHTTGSKIDNQWMHFLTRYHNYAGGVALTAPQPIKIFFPMRTKQ